MQLNVVTKHEKIDQVADKMIRDQIFYTYLKYKQRRMNEPCNIF